MARYEAVVRLKATPREVFAVWFELEAWPKWTPTISSLKRLDHHRPFGMGSKAFILQPKLAPAIWEITELDPDRSFTWVARKPGLWMEAKHVVEAEGNESSVTLSLTFGGLLGSLVGRIYGGLSQRYLTTEAEGLRRECERRFPKSDSVVA